MRNILWKIHTQNVVEKLFPDTFLKQLNGSNKNMEIDSDVSQNKINMTKYKTI